jgi:hypothetical protein
VKIIPFLHIPKLLKRITKIDSRYVKPETVRKTTGVARTNFHLVLPEAL